jgi:formate-dependent phosphoribosylglycinamide formyltransferase (GAR transformylase)
MLRFANAADDRSIVVSALTQIEARSGICRLRKGDLLTPSQASFALDLLAGEMRRIIEQPVNPPVLEAANTAVDRHYLRALAAVQLASAMVARELLAASGMRFISSDDKLLAAAHAEGFETWNPCE